jgi:hypothetical protein
MKPLNHEINFIDLKEKIEQKITRHLADLDKTKKVDKQKILELCQIGKLLASYYSDFDIISVQEKPDFLISNGQQTIGLEHELILESKSKEKEGFYQNICDKVEASLNEDSDLPNFLVNLYLKENISLKILDKNSIIDKFSKIVKQIVLTGEMEENDYIESTLIMKHSGKSVNPNFGAYWQKSITENLILEFIAKKESKINFYRQNSVPMQWLVLVIGSNGQSSYEVNTLFNIHIQTKFDKVFLFEDFANKLYELK